MVHNMRYTRKCLAAVSFLQSLSPLSADRMWCNIVPDANKEGCANAAASTHCACQLETHTFEVKAVRSGVCPGSASHVSGRERECFASYVRTSDRIRLTCCTRSNTALH
ncbi:hypothetical protein BaRGS_00016633 [Batillaria attramentaria]|uniref:Secreted protein n=1 Tax=Batillaria attramentaria TaxID=370345 RepID=A0ABD0KZD7_9CAEN